MLELFGKHEGPQAYVLRPLNSKNALGKVSQISESCLKQTKKTKPKTKTKQKEHNTNKSILLITSLYSSQLKKLSQFAC